MFAAALQLMAGESACATCELRWAPRPSPERRSWQAGPSGRPAQIDPWTRSRQRRRRQWRTRRANKISWSWPGAG